MITLNEQIENDLSVSTFTSVNYVIVVDPESPQSLFLSDYDQVINYEGRQIRFYDVNLNISDITHKIDVKNRSLQVSNAKIVVTNFPIVISDYTEQVDGSTTISGPQSFSDFISSKNIVNKNCKIYLKTPSVNDIEECLLLYTGKITDVTHDRKSIKINLEDVLNPILKEELPRSSITSVNDIIRADDARRVIPAVYGNVEKSPVILMTDSNNNRNLSIYTIADNIFGRNSEIEITGMFTKELPTSGIEVNHSPLYVYKGDYYNVLSDYRNDVIQSESNADWIWDDTVQVIDEGTYCELPRIMNGILPRNPAAANEFQVIKIRTPNDMLVAADPDGGDVDFVDVNARLVKYKDAGVLSPSNSLISFDNITNLDSWSSSRYSRIPNPYWGVEAEFYNWEDQELPGTEDPIQNLVDVLEDSRFHGYDSMTPGSYDEYHSPRGIYCPKPNSGDNDFITQSFHDKTVEWLQLNAHHFNENTNIADLKNQAILTIQPNIWRWSNLVCWKFIYDNYSKEDWLVQMVFSQYISQQEAQQMQVLNNTTASYTPYNPEGGAAGWTYVQMTDLFRAHEVNPIHFIDGSDYENTSGQSAFYMKSGDVNSPQSDGDWTDWNDGNNVSYPQGIVIVYEILDQNIIDSSGYKYIALAQDNGSFSDPSTWYEDGDCKVYNIYDEDNPEQCAIYFNIRKAELFSSWGWNSEGEAGAVPSTSATTGQILVTNDSFVGSQRAITHLSRPYSGSAPRSHQLTIRHTYLVDDNQPDNDYMQGTSQVNQGFFGKLRSTDLMNGRVSLTGLYNYYDYTNHGQPPMMWAVDNCMIYVIMTTLTNVGEHIEDFDDCNVMPDNNLIMQGGTMIPIIGQVPVDATTGSGSIYKSVPNYHTVDFNTSDNKDWESGTYIPQYSWEIPVVDESSSVLIKSRTSISSVEDRLGIAYLFNDLEISDELKADTFLLGRIRVAVESFAGDGNCKYELGVGGVDVLNQADIDFNSVDTFIEPLFSVPMDTINDYQTGTEEKPQIDWYNTWSPADLDSVSGAENIYTTPLRVGGLTDGGFWQVNNYNGLILEHKLNPDAGIGVENLALSTKIWNVGLLHFIILDDVFSSDYFCNIRGRKSLDGDTYVNNIDLQTYNKYSSQQLGFEGNQIRHLEHQISHMIEKELGYDESVDRQKSQVSPSLELAPPDDWFSQDYFDFTLDERTEFGRIVNEIFQTSYFKTATTNREGKLRFLDFSRYDITTPVAGFIYADDVIKYQMRRTPTQDLITMVNIKYKWDYARGDFGAETGWISAYDYFGNGDSNHRISNNLHGFSYESMGLTRESKQVVIENRYVRSTELANKIRNFALQNNCQQKLSFKLTLPMSYIKYEQGDIVVLPELIEGLKAYGEDYTKQNSRNNQIITNRFIVVSKQVKKGNIYLTIEQMHGLSSYGFVPTKGSPSMSWSWLDPLDTQPETFLQEDAQMIDDYLLKKLDKVTSKQIWCMDIDSSGHVDLGDSWLAWGVTYEDPDEDNGSGWPDIPEGVDLDTSGNGVVDEQDLYLLIAQILYHNNNLELVEADGDPTTGGFDYQAAYEAGWGDASLSYDHYLSIDFNQDGYVNHTDFLIMLHGMQELYDIEVENLIAYAIDIGWWYYPWYP